MRFQFLILSALIFLSVFSATAQDTYVPLDPDVYRVIDRYDIKYGDTITGLHTAIKPYGRQEVARLAEAAASDSLNLSAVDRFNIDYLLNDNWNYTDQENNESRKPFLKHFYKNKTDLYSYASKDFNLRVNPVIHFQLGKDTDTEGMRYINTRGLQLEANLDNKLAFYTFISENQAKFAGYVNERINRDTIVPNEGYYKPFKDGGYDFFTARGYITYAASKHFNLQFGHDRNVIGNGYRSLVLSDYAPAYFFLKLNTQVWKLHYMNLFTEMTADHEFRDQLYPKKYFAYHHLSVDLAPNFNVGVFESVVFARDKGKFELQYLNPIIFYRSVEQQLGSSDNALLGADFKWNIKKRVQLYGQLLLDEFLLKEIKSGDGWWANKHAVQVGAKYIDVAGVSNLDIQGEINFIRPYTYAHKDNFTNYSHYQQPLAHPIGANLYELIGLVRYQPIGKLTLTGKLIASTFGTDNDTTNWGTNVLKSYNQIEREFGNEVAQGIRTNVLHADFTASFQFRHNLFIDLKQILRRSDYEINALDNNAAITSVGIRWNIPQRIHEF